MALDAGALTDVATARDYLRSPSANAGLLEVLINGYSKAIARYTERELKQPVTPDADVIRRFRYEGGGKLNLARFDLRSVTSIVLGTDEEVASQTTYETSSYRLEPRNGTPEGTYLWVSLPRLASSWARRVTGFEVTITGRWGCATVPADAVLACLIAVSDGFRNPLGVQSVRAGDYEISEIPEDPETAGRSLPPDARALLIPLRRASWVA